MCEFGEAIKTTLDPLIQTQTWVPEYRKQGKKQSVCTGGERGRGLAQVEPRAQALAHIASTLRPQTNDGDLICVVCVVVWLGRRREQDREKTPKLMVPHPAPFHSTLDTYRHRRACAPCS